MTCHWGMCWKSWYLWPHQGGCSLWWLTIIWASAGVQVGSPIPTLKIGLLLCCGHRRQVAPVWNPHPEKCIVQALFALGGILYFKFPFMLLFSVLILQEEIYNLCLISKSCMISLLSITTIRHTQLWSSDQIVERDIYSLHSKPVGRLEKQDYSGRQCHEHCAFALTSRTI